ncbi:hypothetical protein mRhiFer1_007943 [Rhinolophus ferrumequinum]|uniref:Large ribosomal subunit protein uL15/eL18 domain-containing protein n=1 Tax=Rhinolophus ferrumequinum TaxID=59479 RepID=A0A7J8AVD7_RHIFE|nr:hypothetical protein mRhiFer1_007943 [Rhinolophus ferrumequinum]
MNLFHLKDCPIGLHSLFPDLVEQEAPSWELTSVTTKTDRFGAREPKNQGIYLRLLVKLYSFLDKLTNSTFNHAVLKRLLRSRTTRPPLSLSRMIPKMKLPGREGKTAVVVGTITDDVRVQEVPKLKVCALRVSSRAWNRNVKAGGKILTLDSPRAVALSCSLVRARAETCRGMSARPLETRAATPNPTCAPRAGSLSTPEA